MPKTILSPDEKPEFDATLEFFKTLSEDKKREALAYMQGVKFGQQDARDRKEEKSA